MRTPRLPAFDWTDALRRFKWIRPFRRKTKYGFCACAITFQTQYRWQCTVPKTRKLSIIWFGKIFVWTCLYSITWPNIDGELISVWKLSACVPQKWLAGGTKWNSAVNSSGTVRYCMPGGHRNNPALPSHVPVFDTYWQIFVPSSGKGLAYGEVCSCSNFTHTDEMYVCMYVYIYVFFYLSMLHYQCNTTCYDYIQYAYFTL